MVDPRQKIAWLVLVLAKSLSVEQAARRYGVTARTVGRWAWHVPISCKIAHGSRRISVPLCDVFVIGEQAALWRLLDGDIDPVIADSFAFHGACDALAAYAEKVGHRGHPGHPDVVAVGER
jgi:hypothetical protein